MAGEGTSDKLTSEQRARGRVVWSREIVSVKLGFFFYCCSPVPGIEPSHSCVCPRQGPCHYHTLTPIPERVWRTEEPSCLGQSEWEPETIVGGKVREHTGRQGQITLGLLTSLGIGFSVFLFWEVWVGGFQDRISLCDSPDCPGTL